MLNITNRTPLAGVKLFESSTYPADGIDLYWRDQSPIAFELSDNPDTGDTYPHFLARIAQHVSLQTIQYFQHDESRLITAQMSLSSGRSFWAIMEYDVITLHREKPVISEEYEEVSDELINYLVDVFCMNVNEAVLATSFSPVDLAWLLGDEGRTVGLYDSQIWGAAKRRLPEDLFLSPDWCHTRCFSTPEVVAHDVHPCCA